MSSDQLHYPTVGQNYLNQVHFSLVAQLCPTLCDPMNRSLPGLPVHHQLPEFTQTHNPKPLSNTVSFVVVQSLSCV